MHEFFEDKALPLLIPWNPEIDIHEINDDRAARVLDTFWEANPEKVYNGVVTSAIQIHSLETDEIHFDTTTKSFYGAYENQLEDGDTPLITHGYPKDHRPDLIQLIFGAGTCKDGVPILGEVTDGNASDMVTNGRWVKKLRTMLQKDDMGALLLVADSALVTTNNLELRKKSKIDIISRLPGRFDIEDELKKQALLNDNWTPIGKLSDEKGAASYKAWDTTAEINGETYRFVVVHSDHKDQRKLKALDKAVGKEYNETKKQLKDLSKRPFACRKDAEIEAEKHIKAHPLTYHLIDWEIKAKEEKVKRKKRGRPKKGEAVQFQIHHYLFGKIRKEPETYALDRECCGLFVLITTLMDVENDPSRTILERYKGQGNVERIFRFIKHPSWLGAFCIKKPERIAALGYILLIAALVYVLWERRVRKALARADEEPIEGLNRQKTKRPTSYALQVVLTPILVQSQRIGDELRIWLPRPLSLNRHRVLELSGFSEAIYHGVWHIGRK